ncbi:cytochrome P450 reductase 2 [Byssothecium circinans]|uniref:Cytochrome P450 reductase 2 n=1 Tax=Byssothecium circinans TaxID=147558 RepID=A0A6A5U377_9PLEO|nr:cytochrome P450 reductase 2 [Byssothecium circinans]
MGYGLATIFTGPQALSSSLAIIPARSSPDADITSAQRAVITSRPEALIFFHQQTNDDPLAIMESINIPLDLSDLQSNLNPLFQALQFSHIFQQLKPSSASDTLAVLLFLLTSLGYLTRGHLWDRPNPNYHVYFSKPQVTDGSSNGGSHSTRDIAQRLEEGNHPCVIFWGSQSGTAERFAESLGQQCLSRFGISALVADLSDYDAESIARIQQTHIAIFLLSTYGEGDPSDNTAGLWDWIKRVNDRNITLENLKYFAFGLGNSNYKYYNRVLDVVADTLDVAGATALMPRQKADDANGGTEEDFESWKDDVFNLFQKMGYEQKSIAYQPSMEISFTGESASNASITTSPNHQASTTNSAIVPLVIKSARELFTVGDRNCVHMELDLGSSDLGYKTGDHIGIWPCNPDEEIDRLVKVLGLQTRQNEDFTVTLNSEGVKPKIPSPTTLDTAFRHHLEICGPVARKTLLDIAQFAPTPEAKATLLSLGQNRDRYEHLTSNTHITLARLLQLASPGEPWTGLPLSLVVESLLPLQPRYYSISSSSVISPRRIAITALVVNKALPGESGAIIHGLTSNYLLSTSKLASAGSNFTPTYRRVNESASLEGAQVHAHVRKSKFKLPVTSSTQLILVSAGTGFAPFRAFLHERTKLQAIGKPIGKMLLFFGCRDKDDFIYREEVEKIQSQLGDKLEVVSAFSRDGNAKMYVQDRVGEHAGKVLEMLEAGANMYICGKASMAREVDMKLEDAVSKAKQLNEAEVKAWVDALKKRGKWKADVWG